MAVTKYKVYNFNYKKAIEGSLVAMVLKSVTDGTEVSTAEETGSTTPIFMGVGIVISESPNNNKLTINSAIYSFDQEGSCRTADWLVYKLMLAEIQDKTSTTGNIVETGVIRSATRGADGEITGYTEVEEDSSIMINSLDPRDQFAIHALKTLMEKSKRDISAMSDNEKMHYCEVAYEWAANMMTQASKARVVVKTEDGGGGSTGSTTRNIDIDSSEISTTTDKLLNNIIVSQEKTDYAKDTGEVDAEGNPIYEYAERLKFQDVDMEGLDSLIKQLRGIHQDSLGEDDYYNESLFEHYLREKIDDYIKHTPETGETNTTVGLDDLIKAVKAGSNDKLDEIKTVLTDINTTISTGFANVVAALNNFTSSMNTRFSNVDTAISDAKSDIINAMPSTSGLATSSDVSSAESAIIAAMPSCKYNPPTT